MKTKHILTALALPAMFAACTADDIVSNNGLQQQEQRAKLSKDFVLNTQNEVDSRYAVEGSTSLKFNFEEGDLIGANLIDVYEVSPNVAKFDPEDPATWKIVPYIAPALPFENIGENQWQSAGELGIGNYLFTNPYNPADKNRSAATYKLPIVVQYDSKNPNAHIEDYNKAVAATILREGDTQANISLKNIYTYPKIRVNFPKNDGVTKVTKVILKRNGGFVYEGAFDNAAIAKMFNPDTIASELKKNKDLTVEDYWATKQTSAFVLEEGANIKTNKTLVYEMDEKVSANSIEVRLMIPSVESLLTLAEKNDTHTDIDDVITMYICTDQGNYKFAVTDHTNYTFKGSTLAATKDKALWRSKSNTLSVNAAKLNTASNSEIDELWAGNIVSTAEDWNALVEKYGDLIKYSDAYKNEKNSAGQQKNPDADTLVVTIVGNEFALTPDLKMPEIAEFVIQSDVKVKGDVTLKNIEVSKATNAERKPLVTVKEGSVVTAGIGFQADSLLVEKDAELVFTAAYDKEKLVDYVGVVSIDNYGTVTVPAGVKAKFALANKKNGSIFNVGAPASRATEAVAQATLTAGENNGEVNNYGKFIVAAGSTFTNNAPLETTGYVLDEETSAYTECPVFLNEGTVTVEGTLTNNSEFVNNSVVESNLSASTFENAKVLKVKAGATTIIDTNKNGVIILAEKNPANFTIHDAKGHANYSAENAGVIKYTATAAELAALDLSSSPVTYLIANGNVTLNKTYTYTNSSSQTVVCTLDVLEVNGGDVKVAAATATVAAPAKVAKLLIASGKNTISSKINSVGAIEIYKNASLEVVEGSGELEMSTVAITAPTTGINTLKEDDVRGIFYMRGKMSVTSTDLATSTEKITLTTEQAKFIDLGKDGYISCPKKTDTTKSDAITNAVTLWISEGYSLYNHSVGAGKLYDYNPYNPYTFIATMKRWLEYSETTENYYKYAKAVKDAYAVTGATDATWEDMLITEEGAMEADLASGVTAYLKTIENKTLNKNGEALATAKFITEDGEFEVAPFEAAYHNATYFETQAETYDVVRLALAVKNVTDNATALEAATAWLLTADQISTAMAEVEASKYWFIWADCDMEALVDLWIYYSPQVKGDNCNYGAANRDGESVVTWAKHVKSLVTPAGIAKEAQEALASYTYQDLDKKYAGFDAAQVKALCDKE